MGKNGQSAKKRPARASGPAETGLAAPPEKVVARVMVLGGSMLERLVDGVFEYARAYANWRVQVSTIARRDPVGGVRWHKADAVVVVAPEPEVAETLRGATPHIVAVNPDAPPPRVCSVHIDDHAVGRACAEHLLDYGHRRFAFYGWDSPWARQRLAGFEESLAEAGHDCAVLRTSRGRLPSLRTLDSSHGPAVTSWLEALPRPCGLMLSHDGVAYNFFETCARIGRRIPDDLAVVGVDNSELTCLSTVPPLSSVDTNLQEIGYTAASIVAGLLAGQAVEPEPVLVPPRGVVVRQSTDRHMFKDEQVNRALQFIRDHADEPICVEDVLDHVTISRSSLEARFRKHLGHAPAAEIRRVRLELARKLLLESNLTLIEIGVRCGFSSLSWLSQAFKHAYGVAPHYYRMQHRRR